MSAYDCLNFEALLSSRRPCLLSRRVSSQNSGDSKANFQQNDILTSRLTLVAITTETLRSERSGDGLLGTITNAHVPLEWPPEHWEPHVLELELKRIADNPAEVGWHRYVALRHTDQSRTLIGKLSGFRKTERPEECDVGYSVRQDFQGKGYATEGMKALMDWALARSDLETRRGLCDISGSDTIDATPGMGH